MISRQEKKQIKNKLKRKKKESDDSSLIFIPISK